MNISKRLLTVLMCVAMVLSMMSSFAFALGGAANETVTDAIGGAGSVALKGEALTGNAITNGANPTTNVAAPEITQTVFVYDTSATSESTNNYNLAEKFIDQSTGAALAGAESWIGIYGTNLFSDWTALLKKAGDNQVILAVSGINNLMPETVIEANSITARGMSVYSPYFNVMPYTTGAALDGSDWAYNADFDGAPTLTWAHLQTGGAINVYGFKFGNYINSKPVPTSEPIQLSLVNFTINYNKLESSGGFLYNDDTNGNSGFEVAGASVLMKNGYVAGNETTRGHFLYGMTAPSLTLDGMFFNGVEATANTWFKHPSGVSTTVTITNSNFQNSTLHLIWQGSVGSDVSYMNVDKNIMNNTTLGFQAGGSYPGRPGESVVGCTYMNKYGIVSVQNNRMFSADRPRDVISSMTNSSGAGTIIVKGNYLGAGVDPVVDTSAMGYVASANSIVTENYSVTGNTVTLSSNGNIDSAANFVDFLDAGMTKTPAALYPTSVTVNKGVVSTNNGARTIGWLINDGVFTSIDDLVLTFAAGVSYSWNETPAGFGSYTLTVTDGDIEISYAVDITKPENLFTDKFVSDGIITKDAILLDSASDGVANGLLHTATWKGTEYEFVKGTNVFATAAAIEAWAKANDKQDYQVLCLTKPILGIPGTDQTNHLFPSVPSKWYTQNYNILPYTIGGDGVWSSNIGTGEGQWNNAQWYRHDGMGIHYNAGYAPIEGTYEFYGFQTAYEIMAGRPGNYHLVASNFYLLVENGSDRIGHGLQNDDAVAAWTAIEDSSITVKNSYYYQTAGKTGRLFGGSSYNDLIFTNNLVEDGDDVGGRTTYFQQYGMETSQTFTNNYFKNFKTNMVLEGRSTKANSYSEGQPRTFVFDGNIFDNSTWGESGSNPKAINLIYNSYTDITITNNVIETPVVCPLLKPYTSYSASGKNGADLKLVVEGNHLTNITSTFDVASDRTIDAENSRIQNNYTTADGVNATGLYEANDAVAAGAFYLDSAMTVPSTAAEITDIQTVGAGSIVLSNKYLTIDYNLEDDGSAADLDITVPDGATLTWYSDAACTTPIADLSTVTGGNTVYLMSSVVGGSIVYKVTVVAPSRNLFVDNFSDSSDFAIDPTNVLLLSSQVAGKEVGQLVTVSWQGVEYDFTVGENAFATLAALEAYVAENELEPDVFITDNLGAGNLYVNFPSRFFTQNYNVSPVLSDAINNGEASPAVDNMGSDFEFNSDWNAEYDDQFGGLSNFGVGRNGTAKAGNYLFAGFKVSYTFIHEGDVDTDVTVQNCYFSTNNWGGTTTSPSAGNTIIAANKNDTTERTDSSTIEFKNIYVKPNSATKIGGALVSGCLGDSAVFDNFFVDVASPVRNDKLDAAMAVDGENASIVIRNSCFKNYLPNHQAIKGSNETILTEGESATLTFENNVFINSMLRAQYNGLFAFSPDTFTEVNLINNYAEFGADKIAAYDNGAQLYSTAGGTKTLATPIIYTFTGNVINGCYNRDYTTAGNRAIDLENSIISENFFTPDRSDKDLAEKAGIAFYTRDDSSTTKLYPEMWYTSGDLSMSSYDIVEGMTFMGEEFTEDSELVYEAAGTETKLNLRELMEMCGNYLDVYPTEDCAAGTDLSMSNLAIPSAGGIFYIKVSSVGAQYTPDNENNASYVVTLTITKPEGMFIENQGKGTGALVKTEAEVDYYWLTWRGQVCLSGSEVVEGASGHRAGVIYYSDRTSAQAYKDAIVAAADTFTTVDDIDAALINIDVEIADNTIKAYAIDKVMTLTWDATTQSYGYVYNFSVPDTYTRAAICYAIYGNAEDGFTVIFSDEVVQTVTPAA